MIKKTLVEKKRPYRWVTVLDGDESLNIPPLKFYIGMINDELFSSLVKPYERKGQIIMNTQETKEFRKSVVLNAVGNWQGMCPQNAMRLCQVLAENPELMDAQDGEMPYDRSDLGFIGENLSASIFNEQIVKEGMDLDAYAKDIIKANKEAKEVQVDPVSQ